MEAILVDFQAYAYLLSYERSYFFILHSERRPLDTP